MKAKKYPPGLYNKFLTYVSKKDGKTLSVIPLVLLLIMFSSALLAVDKSSPAKVISGYIENRGQIVNEVYQPRPDILFVYQSPGFTLTLMKDGFSYQLTSVESTNSNQPEAGQFQEPDFQEPDYDALTQYTVNGVDVNFVKPYKGMRIIKQDTADYHFNYYNVKPSVTHVNVFNKIVYENIYKGIDLVFLIKEIDSGRFLPEYQWIIHPNGNINDISLAYNGMDQIYIDERGELFLGKTIGFVKESSPITFVENTLQPSALSFTLKGNVVSYLQHFKSDNKNVIIDPTIIYGFYYGGAKSDEPDEIAYSYNGYLYIAGNTGSPHNMIAGNPTLLCDKLFETGTTDAYLAQFAEDGSLKWGTYIGGDGTGGETKADHAFSVCVDPTTFDPIIAGRTRSPFGVANNVLCSPCSFDSLNGNADGFISKFNWEDGSCVRSIYVGGVNLDYIRGVTCDQYGYIYASGYSESPTGVVVPSTSVYQTTCNCIIDKGDITIMKFSNDLSTQIWGSYCGIGTAQERGTSIVADKYGNIYQTGTTNGKDDLLHVGEDTYPLFQKCKFDRTGDMEDAMILRWKDQTIGDTISGVSLEWINYYGGSGTERGRDVDVDDLGNLYVMGHITTSCSPCTTTTCEGNQTYYFYPTATASSEPVIKPAMAENETKDCFIAKFRPDGSRIWGTYFGGIGNEEARTLSVDPTGAPIYIGGGTTSTNLFSSLSPFGLPTPYQSAKSGGPYDFFFSLLNYWGTRPLYFTYYGGSGEEGEGSGSGSGDWYNGTLAVNHQNRDIYVSSKTVSATGIAYAAPLGYGSINKGKNLTGEDVFLAKFATNCGDTKDAFEPNDNFAYAVQVPMPEICDSRNPYVYGLIHASTDADYYIVPKNIKVRLDKMTKNYNLYVYKASTMLGPWILVTSSANSDTLMENVTIPKGGAIYIIKVVGDSSTDYDPASCYRLYNSAICLKESVNELAEIQKTISLHPNPATQYITIKFPEMEIGKIRIYDYLGRKINDFAQISGTSETIDLSKYHKGLYIAEVYDIKNNGIIRKTFIVQ